jgi:pyruvate-formate lyase-activating enzyme
MKEVFDQYGESFCSAPWNTLWTGANGDIKYCCGTTDIIGNINTQTIESIINGPKANKTRLEFLSGSKPNECEACWEREAKGMKIGHPRYVCNKASANSIAESITKTNPDGSLKEHTVTFVDVIWTNKCNFSCLHCIPSLSSTIASSYKDVFSNWLPVELHNFDYWKNNPESDNSKKMEYILQNAHSIELLHFNGGEPLLQEETFILLDELKRIGLQGKIKLWFHTNGSIRHYKNVDIVEDYLIGWKNCQINISHDHFGHRGEYFRYGYKDKKWLETFHRFKDAQLPVYIDTSITLFNALTLKDLATWYKDNKILERGTVLGWNYIYGPEVWNLINLTYIDQTKNQLQESLAETLSMLNSFGYHGGLSVWKNSIRRLLQVLDTSKDINYHELQTKFVRSIDALDRQRGTNFLTTYPELNNFYREIKNDKPIS